MFGFATRNNTSATIEHLNANKNNLGTPEYREFVTANTEMANELASLITDFVDYGQSRAKYDRLKIKLEVTNPERN